MRLPDLGDAIATRTTPSTLWMHAAAVEFESLRLATESKGIGAASLLAAFGNSRASGSDCLITTPTFLRPGSVEKSTLACISLSVATPKMETSGLRTQRRCATAEYVTSPACAIRRTSRSAARARSFGSDSMTGIVGVGRSKVAANSSARISCFQYSRRSPGATEKR